MRWLFVVLALAGCDKVLGLTEHEPIDAPAAGHDEDKDGLADEDDNCPTVGGRPQPDQDGDGVGDACDPDPNAKNRIAKLYTFAGDENDFLTTSGSWTIQNDQLVHVGEGDSSYSKHVARRGLVLTPPYVIEARFRFTDAPDDSEFSISTALDANDSGSFCTLRFTSARSEVEAYNPGSSSTVPFTPMNRTDDFTARVSVEPMKLRCSIEGSGGSAAATSTTDVSDGPAGFEGQRASTTTDYMIIYTPQ